MQSDKTVSFDEVHVSFDQVDHVDQAKKEFNQALGSLKEYDEEIDRVYLNDLNCLNEEQENELDDKYEALEDLCRESYKKYLVSLGDFSVPLRDLRYVIFFCLPNEARLIHTIPRQMSVRLIISGLEPDHDQLFFMCEPTNIFCGHLRDNGFKGSVIHEWTADKDQTSVAEALKLFHSYTNSWKDFLSPLLKI